MFTVVIPNKAPLPASTSKAVAKGDWAFSSTFKESLRLGVVVLGEGREGRREEGKEECGNKWVQTDRIIYIAQNTECTIHTRHATLSLLQTFSDP